VVGPGPDGQAAILDDTAPMAPAIALCRDAYPTSTVSLLGCPVIRVA